MLPCSSICAWWTLLNLYIYVGLIQHLSKLKSMISVAHDAQRLNMVHVVMWHSQEQNCLMTKPVSYTSPWSTSVNRTALWDKTLMQTGSLLHKIRFACFNHFYFFQWVEKISDEVTTSTRLWLQSALFSPQVLGKNKHNKTKQRTQAEGLSHQPK